MAGLGPGCAPRAREPATETPPRARVGVMDPLPDVLVAPVGGEPTSLRQIVKGKVAVIDLWATWCTACKPVAERAKKLAGATDPARVMVIGVDQGEDDATLGRYLEGRPEAYPIYADPLLGLSDALGVKELPTVVVVDAEGRIRRIDHGVTPELVALVESLAGPAATAAQ
jgi:thiol-disulfide isomerase/thioredoxin